MLRLSHSACKVRTATAGWAWSQLEGPDDSACEGPPYSKCSVNARHSDCTVVIMGSFFAPHPARLRGSVEGGRGPQCLMRQQLWAKYAVEVGSLPLPPLPLVLHPNSCSQPNRTNWPWGKRWAGVGTPPAQASVCFLTGIPDLRPRATGPRALPKADLTAALPNLRTVPCKHALWAGKQI